MRVPPLLGIDLHTIQLHGKVDVISAGHACHAALAHHLAPLEVVSRLHTNAAGLQVGVESELPSAEIQNDMVAADGFECDRRGARSNACSSQTSSGGFVDVSGRDGNSFNEEVVLSSIHV